MFIKVNFVLLCPWERHFAALSSTWWSWQAVLNFIYISIKLKKQNKNFQPDSNILASQEEVGVIACTMNSASDAFLRVRRINIEIK